MSNTRQKILKKSLLLFNSKGLDHVSLRFISKELDISIGNLQYHFKKREEIIHELYFELVATIDKAIIDSIHSQNKLEELFRITNIIVLCFYEYRFIFQDFNSIMLNYPKIKDHYKELLKNRRLQFLAYIEELIEEGLIQKEVLPNEYDNLYLRIQILSDFWMSSVMSQSKQISKKLVLKYTDVINQTIFPYLTPLGKKEYRNIHNLI
ncbi:TetR/AcrR family transcriptional regulator [Aquimarina algicola]|uniref:TetR/AcrR family transcriptional regulator n=1 Tax=Aquimarina algicola TaxID=2589995 RepID=A0A504JGX8_9FLAO|nr:TetR/AcrR family transcriptional regulator [Aquimarina algicola]TPN86923.1 TetR/AcrR family transcriptional regulator [Aquimarina algicola]